ncbi:hypothetical protein RJ639_024834 [Escallonia herrerae]|uniref:Major facilitator superfamily (MFS) profile domain-containing protein n=1 Tax=Escallonia herrerae TaxID=1293975 RepID=A0AA88UY58_9ASTE|nr:hypothetical protein RJ639_024834 [Escallonia herrerae]
MKSWDALRHRNDFRTRTANLCKRAKSKDLSKLEVMGSERVTLILVNLAAIMERADESLLPGVYREVGATLHTDPTGLGSLTLFRSLVQSACYPLAAYLALRHNRTHVIALGAFLWAAATFLVAFSSTFLQVSILSYLMLPHSIPIFAAMIMGLVLGGDAVDRNGDAMGLVFRGDVGGVNAGVWFGFKMMMVAISRGLNGIGLAIVKPAIQSLVADSTDESNRGLAFGWLQLTGNLGSIIGGLCSVLLASTSFLGIPGWRIAFHLVGLISVVVGILVRLFAHDPHFSDDEDRAHIPHKSFLSEVKDLIKESREVIKISSFQIIVAQGVFGSFPWSALSFAPMWLELIGFSHRKTAFLWTIFVIAQSLGGLFGGRMGDILAKRLPNSGRIILSQISAGSTIPLAALLLLVLPDNPSTAFTHGLVLVIMGLSTSWNAPATNKIVKSLDLAIAMTDSIS